MIERYTRSGMGALFTDKHKFDTWLAVELATCEAWAAEGGIPKDAFARIKKSAKFKLPRIREIEAKVHHDVIAFTTAVGDFIGDDSAYFHKGLTSNDVVDTAQNVVLKEAGQRIEKGLIALREAVGKRALEHKHTPAMGRTHGVHAEPTTMGLKLLVWYDELARHEERLAAAIDMLAVGKLSGAVGNFAHLPPKFEEKILKKLGLRPAPVSNQVVQRDRHAQFICALAQLGATMEKIAINLRSWQRTEIGEVQEPFAAGQKGSSAMPHKKNPIILERVTGLARVLRGYSVTALENVALWDERDISHSGAERVILADACILSDYMLYKLTGVIEGLEIRAKRMERNIYFTKGLVFSQRVLLGLTQAGMSREQAYALVQKIAMRCWEDDTPMLDALLNDREVRAVLDAAQLSAMFEIAPFLKHVDEIFERVGLTAAGAKPARARRGKKPKADYDGPDRRKPSGGLDKRSSAGNLDSITVESGAVQNIAERVEDYYEPSLLLADKRRGRKATGTTEPDETLGEAQHQKKRRRRPAGASDEKGAATAKDDLKKGSAAKRPAAKPKAEKPKADKPKPPKPAAASDAEKEKKPRRRRVTRRKKPDVEKKPSEQNRDDTYVD